MTTYPLTPSQSHLLKSHLITPGKPLFNQVITATLSGGTFSDDDVKAMCEAWQSVQHRHPVLGATIIESGSAGFVQRAGKASSHMEVIDLDSQSGAFADTFKAWISDRMQRAFELDKSLSDAAVVRHGQDEMIVYLNMHHLVADAWSTNLILEELIQTFNVASNRVDPSHEEFSSLSASDQQNFFDYAITIPGSQTPTLKQASPQKAQGQVLGTALPSFYGHINERLATASTRKLVNLSANDHTRLLNLSKDSELQQLSENLFQLCFHLTVLSVFLHKDKRRHRACN